MNATDRLQRAARSVVGRFSEHVVASRTFGASPDVLPELELALLHLQPAAFGVDRQVRRTALRKALADAARFSEPGSTLSLLAQAPADDPPVSADASDVLASLKLGFGGFEISLPGVAPADALTLLQQTLGSAWKIESQRVEGVFLARTSDTAVIPLDEAWERLHEVRQCLPESANVELLIRTLPLVLEETPPPTSAVLLHAAVPAAPSPAAVQALAAGGAGAANLPPGCEDNDWNHGIEKTKSDFEWHLKLVGLPVGSNDPAPAVSIGHIDTGYTRHPELGGRITPLWDTWDNDSDPLEDLDPGFFKRLHDQLRSMLMPPQPGHGTATSSVIVSPPGKQAGAGQPYVVGSMGPATTVYSLRATPTVVILQTGSQDEVCEAILRAVNRGVDVISMSLGAPWASGSLTRAVEYALNRGVILCAAAGNVVLGSNFLTGVKYPAALPGVIAVAGCDYERRPWRLSCRGPEVVVTAPATDVWIARARGDTSHPFSICQGSGTSFATAIVAGAAARWLQHWYGVHGGRASFLQSIGGEARLPAVFKECLQKHMAIEVALPGSAPDLPGYDPMQFRKDHFGVGILNFEKLLEVDPVEVAGARRFTTLNTGALDAPSTLACFASACGLEKHTARARLAALLGVGDLDALWRLHGAELRYHFFHFPRLHNALHAERPDLTALATLRSLASIRLARALEHF